MQKEVVTQETPLRSIRVAEGIVGNVMDAHVAPFQTWA
jgi:hypothetical protein